MNKRKLHHYIRPGRVASLGLLLFLLLVVLLTAAPSKVQAMPQIGHYFNGANGLMSSVPMPPGFTYVNNLFMYNTDTIKDAQGKSFSPGNIDIFVQAFTPIWTSKTKILGATYSCMALIPLQNVALAITDFKEESIWGLGDILIEPIWLTWEQESLFLTLRYGFFAPTGQYGLGRDDNIGLGYWTHQAVAGLTWFFGSDHTWHVSLLNRLELHTRQQGHDLWPGTNAVMEWGLGKTLVEGLDVGLTGYTNFQVTSESGSSDDVDSSKYRVFALGAEVSYHVPDTHLLLKLRCNREFAARNHTEGWASALTIAYKF